MGAMEKSVDLRALDKVLVIPMDIFFSFKFLLTYVQMTENIRVE